MSSSDFMNSSEFAAACGVVPSTVKNWIDTGIISPANQIGGKYYFTNEQVIQAKLSKARSLINKSFLGVITEEDESASLKAEDSFVKAVTGIAPKVHGVSSLEDSMEKMMSGLATELDSKLIPGFESDVGDAFMQAVKSDVCSFIGEAYQDEPKTRDFTFNFLLALICEDDELDKETLAAYDALGITNIKYTSDEMIQSRKLHFIAIQRRFGLYTVCARNGFTLADVFIGDKAKLLNGGGVMHDASSPSSKAIYDRLVKKKMNSGSYLGVETIIRDGFYTILKPKGVFSEAVTTDLLKRLTNGDYRFVYVSDRKKLPDVINTIIDTQVASGRIHLI